MTVPRVVATDLDGTLLRPDKTVSARTEAALRRVRDRGIAVVAVTARPPRAIDELPSLAGLVDAAVCSGGAIVYESGRVTAVDDMSIPVARKAAETIASLVDGVGFGVETGFEVVAGPGYLRRDSVGNRNVHRDTIDEVWATASRCVKLLCHAPDRHADELLDLALAARIDGVEVNHSGGNGLLEVLPAGVSKSVMLDRWCAGRGVTAEQVIAFGDMPNDVPMLAWAGTGYAMGNAHPTARAAADAVIGTNADDGVAEILEEL